MAHVLNTKEHSIDPKSTDTSSNSIKHVWIIVSIGILCFVAIGGMVYLYLSAMDDKNKSERLVKASEIQIEASDAQITLLTTEKASLMTQLVDVIKEKDKIRTEIDNAYIRERVCGLYTNVDATTGEVSSAAEKLTLFYENNKITLGIWKPYTTPGTGTSIGTEYVSTTPSGAILGTYSVNLTFDFSRSEINAGMQTSGISGKTYVLTTTNGLKSNAESVRLTWPDVGGVAILTIGNSNPLTYIKDSFTKLQPAGIYECTTTENQVTGKAYTFSYNSNSDFIGQTTQNVTDPEIPMVQGDANIEDSIAWWLNGNPAGVIHYIDSDFHWHTVDAQGKVAVTASDGIADKDGWVDGTRIDPVHSIVPPNIGDYFRFFRPSSAISTTGNGFYLVLATKATI